MYLGGVFQLLKIKVFTINYGFKLFTLLLQRSLKSLYSYLVDRLLQNVKKSCVVSSAALTLLKNKMCDPVL